MLSLLFSLTNGEELKTLNTVIEGDETDFMRENKGSLIRFSARLSIKDKQKKMNLQINLVHFILLCTARFKFCCMNGHLFQLRYSNP